MLRPQWEDISFEPTEYAPYGTIRWKRMYDKMDREHVVAMNAVARDALRRACGERPRIGGACIFPAMRIRPVDRRVTNRWFRRAERLAVIEQVKGRGSHAFRRGFTSSLRHLPDWMLLQRVGKDTATMKDCCQQADPRVCYAW